MRIPLSHKIRFDGADTSTSVVSSHSQRYMRIAAVAARIGASPSSRRLPSIVILQWWFGWTVVLVATLESCHGWQLLPKIPIISSSPQQSTIITRSDLRQVQVRKHPRPDEELSCDPHFPGQIRHAVLRHSKSAVVGLLAMGFWTVDPSTAATAMDYSITKNDVNHHHPNDNTRTSTGNAYYEWDLLNGSVKLPDPIYLKYRDRQTGVETAITLTKPELVGAGGGGAVFALDVLSTSKDNVNAPSDQLLLLKVSWEGTMKTVQRECATLQLLEDRQVQAAERCFGTFSYPHQASTNPVPPRTMILVSPYVRDAVASITDVKDPQARLVAVDQIARNLVQMLAAQVITIDVQPLISQSTGQTIFIDMTEAQTLSSSSSGSSEPSTLQQTLISSYIAEMVALIPSQYWKIAQGSIANELEVIRHRQPNGPDLATSLQSLLEEHTPFFDD